MKFEFPQYRKLSNNKSYYKISSKDELTEIQQVGHRWAEHHIKARILPERNLIQDVLDCTDNHYIEIAELEFDAFRRHCSDHLSPF